MNKTNNNFASLIVVNINTMIPMFYFVCKKFSPVIQAIA